MFLKLQAYCWEDQPELSLRELVPGQITDIYTHTYIPGPLHSSIPVEGLVSFTKEKGVIQ